MVRDYELMYIVRPELDDEALRTSVKSVRSLIETQGGEVVKTTLWGKRRLAYEVDTLRDGHYVLVVLRLDGARVAEIERALRIHDTVFRHLLVLHEGPMPEREEEIEESAPPPDVDRAETADLDVGTAPAETEEDDEYADEGQIDEGDE